MNSNEMNEGNIFFLNFTFNRKLRTLQNAEQVIQLRKKEADVLALLCDNYPNPVSQDDFLMKVWGGGYVTSQSIAQVIRSLRRRLGDDKKSTISTIPKLGYKLTITPIYEDVLPSQYHFDVNDEQDVIPYIEPQTNISTISSGSSISIIAYTSAKKKNISLKKIVYSCLIIILASLVGITLKLTRNHVDNSNNFEKKAERDESVLVYKRTNIISDIDNYFKCCQFVNDEFIELLNNSMINNCFID